MGGLTQEQLEARRRGIGGSDAAAVCGLSRWKSAMDVYLDKIGALPPLEQNEAMYWGTKLEAAVGARFAEEHPEFVVQLQPEEQPVWSDEHEFMCALPDGYLYYDEDMRSRHAPLAGLEIKTASAYKASEWSGDEVPNEYMLQCQHYMEVCGLSKWYLAVLIGGNTYREFVIERDAELIETLIGRETAFWKLVEDKTPPPVDGSKAATEVLSFLHPADMVIADAISLPEFAEDGSSTDSLAQELISVKADQKELEAERSRLENLLKQSLGDHESGTTPSGYVVTWKPRNRTGLDSKAVREEHGDKYDTHSAYRVFDVKGDTEDGRD